MKKRCFKCLQYKPLDSFYKHPQMPDGHVNKCKSCNKKDVQENYRKNIGYYKDYDYRRTRTPERRAKKIIYGRNRAINHPGKARANHAVTNAVRDGRLIRKSCEVCNNPKSEGHHTDYRKKLDVRWLCFTHHRQAHGQLQTNH
jgi:hypothetical protein